MSTTESEAPVSLPEGLCRRTWERIVTERRLVEVTADDGSALRTLTSPMTPEPVGQVRVFVSEDEAEPVAKLVYVGLAVEMIGLDSHMVFAFTRGGSPIPHFTLDSVQGQGTYAFHLDLIPRADLGTHLPYLDWAYEPLTETYEEVSTWSGLSKAAIGPRQNAMMSPWMLVNRADADAFVAIESAVTTYLEHWFGLLDAEVPSEVLADVEDTDLVARDARSRALVFSPEVDKVWAQISRLIGEESAEDVRTHLLDNEVRA
ncbi:hypothetical protein KV097_06380 [Mumia sp. zg.B17]|uniref:hypothetical protein n=1 Tax=unclassified Mumia TaxID=2621872 RepID=UPI001C6F0480|nr:MULTISPECIES: hypothetical protein [unclassified Mumia]MBW9205570.1 hypothetical protein [Mumia sp. zg.B17]MBW9208429.1 hypothetical protein [Mumia sp. zg.B21]MDD9349063.1 hypothetical protein [Mumia sp.]